MFFNGLGTVLSQAHIITKQITELVEPLLEEIGFEKIEIYGQNKLPRMPYAARSVRMVVVGTKP